MLRLLLFSTLSLAAQSARPELFLLGGAGFVSGDDAYRANSPSLSAVASIPFSPRWALDVEASHLPAASRLTHISPGIQYRRGSPSLYGFAAFGPGLSLFTDPTENRPYSPHTLRSSFHAHFRAGIVKELPRLFLFRAQFQSHFYPPGLATGFSIGFGRRF
jgi:hypothetical protein